MTTELFYSGIFKMNRDSLHTWSFRRIHFTGFRYRLTKIGFLARKGSGSFRETGPSVVRKPASANPGSKGNRSISIIILIGIVIIINVIIILSSIINVIIIIIINVIIILSSSIVIVIIIVTTIIIISIIIIILKVAGHLPHCMLDIILNPERNTLPRS